MITIKEDEMLEVHRMANGWLVTPRRVVGDFSPDEERFVFNSWDELVAHIKRELALPEKTVGPEQAG